MGKTTRKSTKEERNSASKSSRISKQSEIPVRNEQTRKVTVRKTSKELDFTSPKRTPTESLTKTQVNRKTTTATTPSRLTQKRTETKTTTKSSTPTRKSKMA